MEESYAIIVENLSKKYRLYKCKKDRMKEALDPFRKKLHKDFYAVKDLNLKVKKGEILGIVGRNGSGKSTLLKLIAGIINPTQGSVKTKGNLIPLLELGSGFNPEYTGLENIYFYSSIMGFSRKETDQKLQNILDFAEIGDFIHQPIKTYSSGMKTRLAFAVSVNVNPDILILDEVLSVGDELFKRKSFVKMEEFFKAGKTILYVSHSANTIIQLCNRAVLIDDGEILFDGVPKEVVMNYHKLLFAKKSEVNSIKGEIRELNQQKKETTVRLYETKQESNKDKINIKNKETQEKSLTNPIKEKKQGAYLIKNFLPKSTNIKKRGTIDISEFQILTLDGRRVNVLVQNEEYYFSYTVKFHSRMSNINFGMSIRTEQGLVLCAMRYPGMHKCMDRTFNNGEVFLIKWKFKCTFLSKNFFLYTSISNIENSTFNCHFAVGDALVFKVLPESDNKCGGFINAIEDMEFINIANS